VGKDIDIARAALGAYEGLDEQPVVVRDGEVFGMVNPCRFGDQCGTHACYCNHEDGPRKCRCSWFTGGGTPDSECELFEPNPYWQEQGDYYESRDATVAVMDEKGLVRHEEERWA
jgi:hypothetical protein